MKARLLTIVLVLMCVDSAQSDSGTKAYERSVSKIDSQIKTLAANLNNNKSKLRTERDQLMAAERKATDLRKSLREIAADIDNITAKMDVATSTLSKAEEQEKDSRSALAALLVSRYKNGQANYAKLLLNQQNPYAVGRLNNYHHYFSEAMQARIRDIATTVIETKQLRALLAIDDVELKRRQTAQKDEQEKLLQANSERANAVAKLNKEVERSSANISRLKEDRTRLNKLIKQIAKQAEQLRQAEQKRREAERQRENDQKKPTPIIRELVRGGFSKQKGRLKFPSSGKQQRKFGGRVVASGMRSDGVFFDTKQDQSVTAIFRGRVLFSDFLKGYGLLLIIDHGDDHISLYGHNELLYKKVGDTVETGEIISTSGTTGGLKSPGLYFEIRENANPIDPALWCRK